MLIKDKGLYEIPASLTDKLIINLTSTRLSIGVLREYLGDFPESNSLNDIKQRILLNQESTSVPDVEFKDYIVKIGTQKFTYLGATVLDLAGPRGIDEIVDFSRIEFYTIGDSVRSWTNRFIDSRFDKNEYGTRNAAKLTPMTNIGYIWMPVNTGSLNDCRIIIPTGKHSPILLGTTVTPTILSPVTSPQNGRTFLPYYWSASTPAALTCKAGGSVNVDVQLLENADNSPMLYQTTLKLQEVAGYAPIKRVTTAANGHGVVRVSAIGLVAGEKIDIKINTEHFSSVGRIIVNVV